MATDDREHPFAQVVLADFPDFIPGLKASEDVVFSRLNTLEPPWALQVKTSHEGSRLEFACHHALYDGAAMAAFMNEVEATCLGKALPSVISNESFLEHVVAAQSTESVQFWSKRLEHFEPKLFSTSISASDFRIFSDALEVPMSAINATSQQISTTLLSLTQSAWAKTLCILLGSQDVCFGNITSGRSLPIDGLERLVAPCFNTVPVRINTVHLRTNTDLAKALHEYNASSLPFSLTSLRRVQASVQSGGRRFYDTLFLLQQSAYQLDPSIWMLKEDAGEMDVSVPYTC